MLAATVDRVDGYLCLGDIVDYGASPNECIELLAGVDLVAVVRGNHDTAVLDGDLARFRTPHGRASVQWTASCLTARRVRSCAAASPSFRSDALGVAAFHGGPLDPEWQYLYPSTAPETLDASLAGVAQPLVFVGHSHLAFRFTHARWTVVNPGSVGPAPQRSARRPVCDLRHGVRRDDPARRAL